MSKSGLWAIAAIACLTLLYLVYLAATFEAPAGRTTAVIPPPSGVLIIIENAAPGSPVIRNCRLAVFRKFVCRPKKMSL